MPRLLPRSKIVEAELRGSVRALIRNEMVNQGLGYRELAERLTGAGLEENERNLRNKVARGELSAALLLACLLAIGTKEVDVQGLASLQIPDEDTLYWTVDRALETEQITVIDRNDQDGLYRVRVGQLTPLITIKLQKMAEIDLTEFRLDHTFVIPELGGACIFPTPFAPSPGRALHQALMRLTDIYQFAIKSGYKPKDEWLQAIDLNKPLPR
jgi:hypothetical protein